ncbi:MAG: S1-like domain-containing RNA-binding protein [Peptostreptococcales bacterium]
MIKIGHMQTLEMVNSTSFGVYLKDGDDGKDEKVLLPIAQVSEGFKPGDKIEVFVYRDSMDRLISTVRRPKLVIGEIAHLEVVSKTKFGAFLDCGLERDLLLPFAEQVCEIEEGKKYLVTMYVDKSDRLCARMDVYSLLTENHEYKEEDRVKGIIYNIKESMGAFVAVDNQFHGLIPIREFYGPYQCGDEIEARVIKVREDGKLELAVREKAFAQMETDAEIIMQKLDDNGGSLPYGDKTDPDIINDELRMSKRAFKRAIGKLLKENKIKAFDTKIEKNSDGN